MAGLNPRIRNCMTGESYIYILERASVIIMEMAAADDLNMNGGSDRECKMSAREISVERVATADLPTETGDCRWTTADYQNTNFTPSCICRWS